MLQPTLLGSWLPGTMLRSAVQGSVGECRTGRDDARDHAWARTGRSQWTFGRPGEGIKSAAYDPKQTPPPIGFDTGELYTLAQFSVSSLTSLLKVPGEPERTVRPNPSSRALMIGQHRIDFAVHPGDYCTWSIFRRAVLVGNDGFTSMM